MLCAQGITPEGLYWVGWKDGRGNGGQSYHQIPASAVAVAPAVASLRFCTELTGVILVSSSSIISGKYMACFSSGTLQNTKLSK
jgi:hypothetical protein